MDVTVLVATFGDEVWAELARARAIPSVDGQAPVMHVHGDTLHEARNKALHQAESEWVCYLDADDELESGFIEAMAQGKADLRAPAVRYVRKGREAAPIVPRVAGHDHQCVGACLSEGNWLVVGSVVRRELVERVGGWRDFEWSEDWDLWLRCHLAGATIEALPTAIYRAHVRPASRNRGLDLDQRAAAHRAIAKANGVAA